MHVCFPLIFTIAQLVPSPELQLRQLLVKHGDFKKVEAQVQKWRKHVDSQGSSGRWVTQKYLEDECHYTAKLSCNWFETHIIGKRVCMLCVCVVEVKLRQMVENSWSWARSRGLLRVNPTHKEEEAKLVLEENFSNMTETGDCYSFKARGDLEDPCN